MGSIAEAARAVSGVPPCRRYEWPENPTGNMLYPDGFDADPALPCRWCQEPREGHADKGNPLPGQPRLWEHFQVCVERPGMPVVHGRVTQVVVNDDGTPIGLWLTRTQGPKTGVPVYVPWLAVTGVTGP